MGWGDVWWDDDATSVMEMVARFIPRSGAADCGTRQASSWKQRVTNIDVEHLGQFHGQIFWKGPEGRDRSRKLKVQDSLLRYLQPWALHTFHVN